MGKHTMDGRGPEPLRIGSVTVDFAGERLIDAAGHRVSLRPQSLAVLRRLAATPDQVLPKSVLMDAVWPGVAVTDDSLVQCIHEIRRALGPAGERALRTVPRRGYVLHPPEQIAPRDPQAPARRRARPLVLALLLLAAGFAAARGAGRTRTP